jgi:hypothetical protein
MQKLFYKLRMFFAVVPVMLAQPKRLLANRRGENFIDSGFKVLIVVVLAALLLAGLYALFSGLIMPMLEERVTDLFNYKG